MRPEQEGFDGAVVSRQQRIPEGEAVSILERITDAFFALDTEWRFTYVNTQAERLLHRTRDGLLGKNIWDEFPEAVGTAFDKEYRRAVSEQTTVTFDEYYSPLQTHFTVHAYPAEDGLSVYFENSTERKKEERRRIQWERRSAFGAEVGVAVNQSGTLQSGLQSCAEAMVIHLDAALARIWTLDAEEEVLELQASAGRYTHLDGPHGRVPVGQFKIGLIAQERKPHLTNTVVGDPRVSDQEWARREGMVAFAGYPLVVSDQLVGVIAMFAREVLTEDTLNALALVADMLAQTIQRKRTEQALQESQRNTLLVTETMPQLVWSVRADGFMDYCNSRWCAYTGMSLEQTREKGWSLFHAEDVEQVQRKWMHALQTGEEYINEYRIRRASDGAYRWFLARALPLRNDEGEILRWYGTCTDIDGRKRAEQMQRVLAEVGQRMRAHLDPEAMLWEAVSVVGPYLQVSRCHYGEIDLNEDVVTVHRDYCDGVPSHAGSYPLASFGEATAVDLREGRNVINEDTKMDPRTAPFYETIYEPMQLRSFIAIPLVKDGHLVTVSSVHDAKPRQWQPDEIELVEKVGEQTWLTFENAKLYQNAQALNQKLKRAMTETHHRVKNNLQLISALIDMQRGEGRDVVPISEFVRLGQNVQALGVIHDVLTKEAKGGGDQETLSAREVLEKLLSMLVQTLGSDRPVKFQLEDVRIPGRQVTSLALVTNELVANALKHGKGRTDLCFRTAEGQVILEVLDDGPGFPDGFDPTKAANTGLELIENISRWDLGGETSYTNRAEGGARVIVSFPIKSK